MPSRPIQAASVACSFLMLLAAAGCRSSEASEPAPVLPPAVEHGARHFVGNALSGPIPSRALPEDRGPASALRAHCRVSYHETLPRLDLPPLGTKARLIGGLRGGQAILATPLFTTRAQFADAEAAPGVLETLEARAGDRSVVLFEHTGALLVGTSVVFAARSEEPVEAPVEGHAYRRVALVLSRGEDDALDLGVLIDQLAEPAPVDAEIAAAADLAAAATPYADVAAGHVLRREALLLAEPLRADGGAVLLLVPSPFPGDEGAGFSALIDVSAPPFEGEEAAVHAETVATCLRELEQEQEAARDSTRRLAGPERRERRIEDALQGLHDGRAQRTTLVFLTSVTGAPLAEDLALVAADGELPALEDALVREVGGHLDAREVDWGWRLERGAFRYLLSTLSDAEDEIPPGRLALLLEHAGEAGQFPATIEDALAISNSVAELEERLVQENRIFLEDYSVAARVRAYDWLAARERAPEGYDPLESSDARRAALRADRARREAAAAEEETRP